MNLSFRILLVALSLLSGVVHIQAQGTAFIYQGRLNADGGAASGNYDFRFQLASDALGSNYVGSPLLLNAVPVSHGLFTATLDFGAGIFTGANFWLQVEVKTNGAGGYATLTPLQAMTPAPYAITASNLSGTLPAAQLSGTVASANLAGSYTNALTLSNAANSFSGSGAGLTALNASELTSGTVPDARLAANLARTNQVWLLGGNTGTTPDTHFLGSTDNQPLELRVNGTRALRLEPTVNDASHSNIVNVVEGSSANFVGAGVFGATIGGGGALNYSGFGRANRVEANFGTVSGGIQNAIQTNADWATLGGGAFNTIQTTASGATLGGGYFNTIQPNAYAATLGGGAGNTIQATAQYATLGGGINNSIETNAFAATIAGGEDNSIQTNSGYATIGGGINNTIQPKARYATISGGYQNTIQPNASDSYATIGGGGINTIQSNAFEATIGGGFQNTIQNNAQRATIGGGYRNTIQTNAVSAIIGGGSENTIQTNASYATIGGGINNTIQTNAAYATIGGGYQNTIQPNASDSYATIGGGGLNAIQNNAFEATISGGYANTIEPNAERATIGGGYFNTIQTNADAATLGGGLQNTIQPNAGYATIGGGVANTIQANAERATVGGGDFNTIQTSATFATIGGGYANTILANAFTATIPGGYLNSAASYAFAAGRRAKAIHSGSFVWADTLDADFASTANNQFNIRAAGGVRLSDSTPQLSFGQTGRQMLTLYDSGVNSTFGIGVQSATFYQRCGTGSGFAWYQGGTHNNAQNNSGGGATLMLLSNSGLTVNGAFVSSSDRNAKENFASVQPREMLEKVVALPLSSWNYKADTATRHVGPMAQDFYAAFGVGPDDKHIATVDADGVALAAIQGLNQKVEDQRDELEQRLTEITELKARLEKLEQRMLGTGAK